MLFSVFYALLTENEFHLKEANKMVIEAKTKQASAEMQLKEAAMKVIQTLLFKMLHMTVYRRMLPIGH